MFLYPWKGKGITCLVLAAQLTFSPDFQKQEPNSYHPLPLSGLLDENLQRITFRSVFHTFKETEEHSWLLFGELLKEAIHVDVTGQGLER